MSERRLIDTAPFDGTHIRVKNSQMTYWVVARYGRYQDPDTGAVSGQWIIEKDLAPTSEMFRARVGSIVVPDEWLPYEGRML